MKREVDFCDKCGKLCDANRYKVSMNILSEDRAFCDEKCLQLFVVELSPRQNRYAKNGKRRSKKPIDMSKRKADPRFRCGACGLYCSNSFVLAKHIRAKHDPQEYFDTVKKTGGMVIDSDGKTVHGATKPMIERHLSV